MYLILGCDGPGTPKGGATQAVHADPPKSTTISSTTAPASSTYDLRGAPVQGATRRSEVAFEIQDAQLTMSVGDVAMSGVMSIKSQITEDLEILEVGEGLVRKGRLNHVLDKSKTTLRVKLPDGTEQSEPTEDNGALHGRVEAIEFISGQWKRTLEGPAPTPEQARLLASPPIDDAMYPTAVKVGESWTETGPELRRWLGSDVLSARGEVKNTLFARPDTAAGAALGRRLGAGFGGRADGPGSLLVNSGGTTGPASTGISVGSAGGTTSLAGTSTAWPSSSRRVAVSSGALRCS